MIKPNSTAKISSKVSVFGVQIICVLVLAQAQAQSNYTTHPSEAEALNSIFERWGISAEWNNSGELCSGAALGPLPVIDDVTYNPFIKCNCSHDNGTTCRVTALKVYALNIVGTIPDELWTLIYLTSLNLAQNFLNGNLSQAIGNLTRMQYLSIGINLLSGELPEELGLLTDLRSFGFGTNNFSGPLPSALGNCVKLEQIYLDSSGVSGGIPSTFAKLKNMKTMWASDTELTGRIPNFIGSWLNLVSLRLEGNSFEGPIPSALSSLTSLTQLRISDVKNGTSSLEFIKDMKSLIVLDLSFNNITGQLPETLFSLSQLSFLFMGNNNLDGPLPSQKGSSLLTIDVSYNNLEGRLPSWVNNEGLQVNLVANNFTLDLPKSSGLPSGLNCLQRNPVIGIPQSFAIKCGGPQIISSNNIVYERDNETLGSATYYVSDTERWGVSNVGLFNGDSNPKYTVEPELFQTARISASSLRYYGLGLQNGNYSVNLLFAETAIQDDNTWLSLGRRIFDVYVQGNLVWKDFNIRNAEGGVSKRAVVRAFNNITVSENYLEIHLFWAGKGTCCIPFQGTYGPSISAISVTPEFVPTVSNRLPTTKVEATRTKDRTALFVGIPVGVGVLIFLLVSAIFFAIERRKKQRAYDEELLGIDACTFNYTELKTATEDFSPANKLGEGGFGLVYKGKLSDGRVVAVKQLSVASHQGKSQFVADTISAVQHRNLVKLHGCCIQGKKRLLVYEHLENKSLDQALFGQKCLILDWQTRYNICVGVARGLAYLHEESRLRIVHRDVKASNILLDHDLVLKISDFGLAKLYDDKKTHISTRVAGTIGYLSPEYALRGYLTEKVDVFGFGVVALEVISGRPNSDLSLEDEKIYLLEWAWNLHENNREEELVDSRLSKFNGDEVKRLARVALLCTQTSPHLRPPMSRVVAMLCGDMELSEVSSKPEYLTAWKFDHMSSFAGGNVIRGTDTNFYTISSSITSNNTDADDTLLSCVPMLEEMSE